MASRKRPYSKHVPLAGDIKSLPVLFVILALTLVFRLVIAEGPLFNESLTIAEDSKSLYSFDSDNIDSDPGIFAHTKAFLRELRSLPSASWPVTVGLGLFYTLFGVSDLTSIFPGLVAALFTGIIIFILGAQMFDEATGLLAAFLWAILPLGIFLSINILPIVPLVALNLLAMTLFFLASRESAWKGYLPAALVTAGMGLGVDWTIFLPTVFFMILFLLRRWQMPKLATVGFALGLLTLVVFLFPGVGAAAAELYGLNLLLFDNFLVVPLFVISLVFVAGSKRDLPTHFILLWLAVKAAFVFIAASYILQDPWLQTIGFSGYWIDLIPPVLIVISLQFVRRFNSLQIKKMLLGIGSVVTLVFLFLIPVSPFPAGLATISRISVGAAFLGIFLYLAFWRKERQFANFLLLGALLILLTIGSPSIANNYVNSYIDPLRDAREVRSILRLLDDDPVIFIGDDLIYERLYYFGGFQNLQTMDEGDSTSIYLLNPNRSSEAPEGAYVLVSFRYMNFVLGIAPSNWDLIREFSVTSGEGYFLYRVAIEESS